MTWRRWDGKFGPHRSEDWLDPCRRAPVRIPLAGGDTGVAGGDKPLRFQDRYVTFEVRSGDRVLAIGSGGDPFPRATFSRRDTSTVRHRHVEFETGRAPAGRCDVQALRSVPRVSTTCTALNVLEHVDDPLRAARRSSASARRGFIETPARCKDILFAWAEGMHAGTSWDRRPPLFFRVQPP